MAIINAFPIAANKYTEVFQFGSAFPGARYKSGKITSIERQTGLASISSFYSIYKSTLTYIKLQYCLQINYAAFDNCKALLSVDFPACTSIGQLAFYGCSSLTTISFPACITIGTQAFAYCKSLATVNFPVCTTIGTSAFDTANIVTAYFPACASISSSAFRYCKSLASIYFLGSSIPNLASANAFYFTPISSSSYLGYFGSIYVPSSLLASYKTTARWSVYSSRMVGI